MRNKTNRNPVANSHTVETTSEFIALKKHVHILNTKIKYFSLALALVSVFCVFSLVVLGKIARDQGRRIKEYEREWSFLLNNSVILPKGISYVDSAIGSRFQDYFDRGDFERIITEARSILSKNQGNLDVEMPVKFFMPYSLWFVGREMKDRSLSDKLFVEGVAVANEYLRRKPDTHFVLFSKGLLKMELSEKTNAGLLREAYIAFRDAGNLENGNGLIKDNYFKHAGFASYHLCMFASRVGSNELLHASLNDFDAAQSRMKDKTALKAYCDSLAVFR